MRAIILCLLAIMAGCQSVNSPKALPGWFEKLHTAEMSIGYGYGLDRNQAYEMALQEIARSLKVKVTATSQQQVTTSNGTVDRNTIHNHVSLVDENLSGVKLLKSDQAGQWYFVALGYRNASFLSQLQADDLRETCTKQRFKGYLQHTPLAASVRNEVGCLPGMSLAHRHGQWLINLGRQSYLLSEGDFAMLFTTRTTDNLSISASAQQLSQDDLYHLQVESKAGGYLTMLQIDASGASRVLTENLGVNPGSSLQYPDTAKFEGLQAKNVTGVAYEPLLTLALRCDTQTNFNWLPPMSSTHQAIDNQAQLEHLLLTAENCETSAVNIFVMHG